jgi:hypothetical protein
MNAAIQNWPGLSGNTAAQPTYEAECDVDPNPADATYGEMPSATLTNAALLSTCGSMICYSITGYSPALDQLDGNCGVNVPNCGGVGLEGFGVAWSCMYGQ